MPGRMTIGPRLMATMAFLGIFIVSIGGASLFGMNGVYAALNEV